MKRIHFFFSLIAFIILVTVGLWGWLYSYASQQTIPKGVRIADWEIGGLTLTEFQQQWAERLKKFADKKIAFKITEPKTLTKTASFKQLGIAFNDKELRDSIMKLQEGSLWERARYRCFMPKQLALQASWKPKLLKNMLSPAWERQTMGDAVDAVRWISPNDEVSYIPDQPTFRINWEKFQSAIDKLMPADFSIVTGNQARQVISMDIPLAVSPPKITLKALKNEGIDRKIVEFTTSFTTSEEGRAYNVAAAANTINGMILKPGDVFDYGKVIASAEKKYGFREAPVIFQGRLVPGVGGGICQVSSTLYNAVLRTGIQIVERRNHSLPVSYLPIGQDATFSEGNINFRFRNTTGKSLLIRSDIENKQLTIKLFGTMAEDLSYDIQSNTVKVLDPPIKYVSNISLDIGEQEMLQEGKQGFIVETYQIKKKAGKIVERKRISRDTYRPQPMLIGINTGDNGADPNKPQQDPSPNLIVEDGIKDPDF